MRSTLSRISGPAARLSAVLGAVILVASCTENLPTGPNTFGAHLTILAAHDTLVVGDANLLTAQTKDDQGNVIQRLSYTWASSNAAVATVQPTSDTTGQTTNVKGGHTGTTVVGLSLPDPRFTSTQVTRTQTVVVAGIKVLTAHDSTLTAVNDTGAAVANGLIHSNGASVTSPGQSVRWTHLGSHVTTFGGTTGAATDTMHFVARSNGTDSLIATDDFCLAGAKCADTTVVHVSQTLTLTLSSHVFQAWSLKDSVGPAVRLADRRGSGLTGTSIRFVPVTSNDSAIVSASGPIGSNDFTTGQMASPRAVAGANGIARVAVLALNPDFSVITSDTITIIVRQVARRVMVEPLRAMMTANDSIPIRPVARDARGAVIPDAAITVASPDLPVHDIFWAGPVTYPGSQITAAITPTLTGVALPANNPGAPQIQPEIDPSQITILQPDTAKSGTVFQRNASVSAFDSLAQPALGKYVRFGATLGNAPDSVQVDGSGSALTTWQPTDSATLQTLTGLRGILNGPTTLADSAGRIVLRHSVLVLPGDPTGLKSTVEINALTINAGGTLTLTVRVRDAFGNLVTTAQPADVVPTSANGGMFSNATCTGGVCTITYTAPAAPGNDTIHIKINSIEVFFSPISITVT